MTKKRKRTRRVKRQTDNVRGVDELAIKNTEDALLGGKIEERDDKALFIIDSERRTRNIPIPSEERKKLSRDRVLNVDRAFQTNPHVKPENGGYCPKSKQKKRLKTSNQKSKPEIASTSFDIWSDDSKGDGALSPDWFQPTIKSELKPRKQIKPSTRDAIEIVESGASYNPSSTDHHNLLKKAADIRLEGLKKEKKYRQYSRGISSLGPQQVDLPVNIPSEDDNSETNDIEVEQTSNYVQHVERKTKTERNREKRRKIHESTVQKNFEAKLRRRELETLDQSLESIIKQETLRQVEKKEPDYDKGQEIKKLGKIKYKEDEPEFLLPDELPGSMRRLPGKYSVLKDRFESLQKRNIIETRVPSKQILKYPKKVFDKSK